MTQPSPSSWSLTLGNAGKALVSAATAGFAAAAVRWPFGAQHPWRDMPGKWNFVGGAPALFGAFSVFAVLFAANRLEYAPVWGQGGRSNTLPNRIAGIWAGKEGSLLP